MPAPTPNPTRRLAVPSLPCALLLSCFLAWLPTTRAAESPADLDGRRLFVKLCSECHGKSGEGVPGKYKDPLAGDLPVNRLARLIDETMPEDHPELCNAQESDAVARYIHGAFYSKAARATRTQARIELSRLTNKQYLNTVADLFEPTQPRPARATNENGLRASYYNARGFNRDKKITDRVDPEIAFDFGSGSPPVEGVGAEEFSMQWRGSLLADDTGDYEIVVISPNGFRLWLNDDREPLIDAWVASGQMTEHRTHLRLIGGRAYPLRVDYFKFKDKTASIMLQWKPPHGARQTIPARNLATEGGRPTLVIQTPFPPDDSSVGYERGVGVSKAWDEATTGAAVEVANHVVARLDSLTDTRPDSTNRLDRTRSWCHEFVAKAFRRPLDAAGRKLYVDRFFRRPLPIEESVKQVVLLTLKSPRFLYFGLERGAPDGWSVATRLAYGLWDSIPDAELVRLAAEDALRSPEQVESQARRMLGDPRARAKLREFLHGWLQVNHTEDLTKDPSLYPGFTPEIISDLRTSLDLFLEETVWNGGSDYRQLLLADHLYVNQRLAQFYGLPSPEPGRFQKARLDPEHRAGVLTHPYLLAAFSYRKSTSPIHRGVFLTRSIVGRALRSPPVAVAFNETDFSPDLTMREKVVELTRPASCQGCHAVINPLGFSLEHFDAVGRFRTQENRRPVDVRAEYITDDGETVELKGSRSLAEFAASSDAAQDGFIEQLFHAVVKQPAVAYDPRMIARLRRSFVRSGYNIQALLVQICAATALHSSGPSKRS